MPGQRLARQVENRDRARVGHGRKGLSRRSLRRSGAVRRHGVGMGGYRALACMGSIRRPHQQRPDRKRSHGRSGQNGDNHSLIQHRSTKG